MNENDFNALEVCLLALETGATVDSCLALFPDLSDELRPVMEGAVAARSLLQSDVPKVAQQRSYVKLLARAAQLRSAGQTNPVVRFWSRATNPFLRTIQAMGPTAGRLAVALIISLTFVLTSSGLLVVSAESLPGDALYPVKRVFEDLRTGLAGGAEGQHSMEEGYSQQRVLEVQNLIELGRSQMISFEGVVENISSVQWIVEGISIRIDAETTFVSPGIDSHPIVIGDLVEVEGLTCPEGWVEAQEIHLREYQFSGILEEITSNRWVVSQVVLKINTESQIDPGLRLGDPVVVLARFEDSGALIAQAILFYRTIVPIGQTTAAVTAPPTPVITATPLPTIVVSVEDDEVEFTGRVMVMNPDFWIVGNQIIYVTGETEIDDPITIGSLVSVKAALEANGSLTAEEIKLDDDSDDSDDGDSGEDDLGDDGDDDDDDDSDPGDDDGDDDPIETEEPEEP